MRIYHQFSLFLVIAKNWVPFCLGLTKASCGHVLVFKVVKLFCSTILKYLWHFKPEFSYFIISVLKFYSEKFTQLSTNRHFKVFFAERFFLWFLWLVPLPTGDVVKSTTLYVFIIIWKATIESWANHVVHFAHWGMRFHIHYSSFLNNFNFKHSP